MDKFKLQVSKENYDDSYEDLKRFISYYHQIEIVRARGKEVKTILEIGIGNKTVANYLNAQGYEVKTCDFDRNLNF